MKINDSKIGFFYLRLFFRIGTFQWVTADLNRIFSSFIWNTLWLYWRGTHSSCRSTARSEGFRQSSLASPSILTKIFALRKKMSANYGISEPGRPFRTVNNGSPRANHRLSIKISSLTKFKCGPRCCAPPVKFSTSASIAIARSPILIVPRSPMSAAPVSASRNAFVNAP
jgi:hypothetical protein